MPLLSRVWHQLAVANPWFAALALGLYIVSLWIGAVRWQRLLAAMGCRVGAMRLLLVNLIGISANNLTLNSRIGGEAARLAALHATDGVSADRLAVSTVYERIVEVIGGAPIVLLAMPAAWALGSSLRVTRSVIGLILAAGVATALAFAARPWLRRHPLARWWREAASKYVVSRSTLAFTLLCSVAIHIQDPLRLMAAGAAFGVSLTVPQASLLTVASLFAGSIPTVGALGGIESGLIATLLALKVGLPTALAITALERGISLVFSTVAGGAAMLWLGGRRVWRRADGASLGRGPAEPARRDRPVVLVICGNGPDPITLRKIEAITSTHDVHLVYWRDGESLRAYPFSVAIPASAMHAVNLPDPNGPPLRGLALLLRFHARLLAIGAVVRPDVVHAVNFDMLLGGWLLCLGRPGRMLVYDLLDTHDSMRRWPNILLQRLVMRRVDRIYTTSPQFVSGFLRPLALIPPDDEPVVIPNAPWAATFDGIGRRSEGSFVIGCIGSFRCDPALAWLCESVAELRQQNLDVEILFAGTGEARPLVESLARRHPFVRHEGAYDYARDIRSLYERVDFVFAVYDASWDKRTHLASRFSDAIASGRPIVAVAGTYMGELVQTHGLGYVVDFADRASLRLAIRDAISRRANWSEPSRIPAWLRREHTFENYIPQLRSSYAAALAYRRHGYPRLDPVTD